MKNVLVLLSTYNGEKYLVEQLDSIINQTQQLDILVRDDGSTDGTVQLLQTYAEKYINFKFVEGKNLGFVGSYVELMKIADRHDYYAFSDQDDIWMPDKIETAIQKLEDLDHHKPCLYASCSLIVNNDMKGHETTQYNHRGIGFENIIIQNLMPAHSQVFNNQLLEFALSYPIDGDQIFVHDYWLALIAITFGEFYFDNAYHTYYRQHDDNSLGYGHGIFSWITERIDHVKHGAARQITRQDQYFYDLFHSQLKKEEKEELYSLLNSQKNIWTRAKFLRKTKVYRQRKFETLLFYILYLFGGYKIT